MRLSFPTLTRSHAPRCSPSGRADPHPALHTQAETQLDALLRATGIPRSGVYRPGEVCRLLRISRTTLLQLCALREHPAVGHPNPCGLVSCLVGCQQLYSP